MNIRLLNLGDLLYPLLKLLGISFTLLSTVGLPHFVLELDVHSIDTVLELVAQQLFYLKAHLSEFIQKLLLH